MSKLRPNLHPDVHADERPDVAAYTMAATGEVVTWAQLRDRSRQCGHLLRRRGLGVGDGFAIFTENHPRFLELCWAAQRSGLYFTPVSWHLTAAEIEYIVRDSGSKLVFVSPRFADVVADLRERLGDEVDLLSVGDAFGGIDAYEPLRDQMPTTPVAGETSGDTMLYTSGTTGRPKGVRRPLTGTPITEYPPSYALYAASGWDERSVHFSAGPLYHASPLSTTVIGMTLGGSVVVSDRFSPEGALAAIERYSITHSNWVPTHFVRLLGLDEEARERYDVSSLELALHGAAPCPTWVKERMIEWWGPILVEYYGGSEGFGGLMIDSETWLEHRGSVGQTHGRVHILDEHSGEEQPAGEVGLVYFETQATMRYHNDDEKTASVFSPQGWATLGDLGFLDDDGFLYLADRRTDLILTGGVNVYPREVEERLLAHDAVADAAVFGVPNDEWGETVHAVVELAAGWPTAPDDTLRSSLDRHCRAELSSVKCPRGYDFVDELPRAENGKLYKRLLRDRYAPGQSPGDAGSGGR